MTEQEYHLIHAKTHLAQAIELLWKVRNQGHHAKALSIKNDKMLINYHNKLAHLLATLENKIKIEKVEEVNAGS